MKYRLGIDVGGTNTDAVIVDENNRVVTKCKVPTTPDVSSGINSAVEKVLKESNVKNEDITTAMLGTTHATNAIIERKGLSRVGVIRLSAPSGLGIPPFIDWPDALLKSINYTYEIVKGGYEYNGKPISEPDKEEIKRAIEKLMDRGVESIAISCAFSPVNGEQEIMVKEMVEAKLGDNFPVTLSHEIGSLGLIERENAAILNAAIRRLAENAYGSFQNVLKKNKLDAELFITQNDGTLMSIEYAKMYPVLTIASGPTNSLRGAAFLSGLKDAIVVDVGGTTTDVGVLSRGFPRESSAAVEMGGVRTNFRMPDLISIGLGGGSIVTLKGNSVTVGPQSVGYKIVEEAIVFGGKTLTATDIAVAEGLANLGDKALVSGIDKDIISKVRAVINEMIENAIDKMKVTADDVDVIVVGGGSIIVSEGLKGVKRVIKPENFEVANAIGATIAQVSGSIDGVYDVVSKSREKVIEEVKEAAIDEAVKAGADRETVEIVDIEEIPLAYLPSNAVRFKVKAVGNLKK